MTWLHANYVAAVQFIGSSSPKRKLQLRLGLAWKLIRQITGDRTEEHQEWIQEAADEGDVLVPNGCKSEGEKESKQVLRNKRFD